jgi:hypothetical protein
VTCTEITEGRVGPVMRFSIRYLFLTVTGGVGTLTKAWLEDIKQGEFQPEISLAEEIAKVECEGHPLVKIL